MDDDWSIIIWIVFIILAVVFSVYFFTFAAIGGAFFGGGVAVFNYGKSFKKNIIDSKT